jgi:predicted acyl esterase
MPKKTLCLLVFAVTALPSIIALGQIAPEIVVERGVVMTTRDGVKLRADIYRPAGEGTFPVLLTRTPYDKNGGIEFARMGAARGYNGHRAGCARPF